MFDDHMIEIFEKILSYLPIIIIISGLIGNSMTLIIFRLDKELKNMPTMIYFSFVCITDTLSLFTFNLNHFLLPNFGFILEQVNIGVCKFFQFIQFFSLQSSALLIALASIDRYVKVIAKPGSLMSKLPFGTVKCATVWSILLMVFVFLLNSYMLILDRAIIYQNESIYNLNNTLTGFELKPSGFLCHILFNGFNIYYDWQIHLIIYPIISFIIMLIFNMLLIQITFRIYRKKTAIQSTSSKKSTDTMINISLSLIFFTFAFMIMCLPAVIAYNYFFAYFHSSKILTLIIHILDAIGFINRASIFINCMISNIRFRKVVLQFLKIAKIEESRSKATRSIISSRNT
jgi:hypothetical protein